MTEWAALAGELSSLCVWRRLYVSYLHFCAERDLLTNQAA